MAVSGMAVAAAAAGGLLVWSGLKGAHVTSGLRSLLAGQQPKTGNAEPITTGGAGTPAAGIGSASVGAIQGGLYSNSQLQSLWIMAGGSPAKAAVAACIADHESSGQPGVTSPNPSGGTNVGLWQLDTQGKGAGHSVAELQNPLTNARVTVQASANGTNWSAWATAAECGA